MGLLLCLTGDSLSQLPYDLCLPGVLTNLCGASSAGRRGPSSKSNRVSGPAVVPSHSGGATDWEGPQASAEK